ncbi:fucose isomerase [Thermus sediminis]|uniref:fucose isomerase n=1 Tax=Thermus sediminis TaxID=1761908 RepID=UPI000E3E0926|nr:fucose isomerase [Thermus sediminis]
MEALKVFFVPALRPLFRGASLRLEEGMVQALVNVSQDLGFTLYPLGPVRASEEALAVARRLAQEEPDLLILGVVTFATGDVLGPLLDLPVPKILWAIPEAWLGDALPQNALCGLNLALSLPQARLPVRWFYGPPKERELRRLLEPSLRALRALRLLRRARLLWLGGPAPGFDAFWERPTMGASVEERPLEELFATYEGIPGEAVKEALEAWPEARGLGEEGKRLARLALALRRLGQDYDGIALRDWPEIPERLGVVPSASIAHLGDLGLLVALEGDLMGLLSQLALKALGGQAPILVDIVAVEEGALLLWHGGEAPLSWAAGPAKLVPHFNRGLPAVRDMVLRAGAATGLRLTRRGVALVGGRLEGKGGYLGASGWLREIRWAGEPVEAGAFLERWLGSRLPHHLALAQGDLVEAGLELAFWGGLGVLKGEGGVWGAYWR